MDLYNTIGGWYILIWRESNSIKSLGDKFGMRRRFFCLCNINKKRSLRECLQ